MAKSKINYIINVEDKGNYTNVIIDSEKRHQSIENALKRDREIKINYIKSFIKRISD